GPRAALGPVVVAAQKEVVMGLKDLNCFGHETNSL
ncbi:MAG: hypothetical protein JWQ07_5947, partial [Ramlibacter sp.]|nr:hypothetical protein [Ramlibacter sp.]